MEQATSFFVVFGDAVKMDLSNVKTIDSLIIPQAGNIIKCFNRVLIVTDVYIVYENVCDYDKDDVGRGGELIYVFTKPNS